MKKNFLFIASLLSIQCQSQTKPETVEEKKHAEKLLFKNTFTIALIKLTTQS